MLEVYLLRALTDNFVYVLRDRPSGQIGVVDPSTFDVVDSFLTRRKWPLHKIFCTHHHEDHVGGALELRRKFGAEILTSSYDFQRIRGATLAMNDGNRVELGECVGEALAIPGHTLGHWALYFPRDKMAFVGDTVFSAGCGRLFEGTFSQMFNSLNRLKKALAPETQLFFGHEYTLPNLDFVQKHCPDINVTTYLTEVTAKLKEGLPTTPSTLAVELQVNPFMRATTLEEFKKIRELRNAF